MMNKFEFVCALPLDYPTEYVTAMTECRGDVIIATNTGRVFILRGKDLMEAYP